MTDLAKRIEAILGIEVVANVSLQDGELAVTTAKLGELLLSKPVFPSWLLCGKLGCDHSRCGECASRNARGGDGERPN